MSPQLITYNKAYTVQKTDRTLPFLYIKLAAAVSVEASIALPIFLFFIANLCSLFLMYQQFSVNLVENGQKAKEIACMSTDLAGDDIVTQLTYQKIFPLINIIGFQNSSVIVGMKYRKWNGYNITGIEENTIEEEYVYITESGTVYHRSRNCSHLIIKIITINENEVVDKRNKNGEKYKPCERCSTKGTGVLFITPEGNKYHSSAGCSGLKRKIKTVKLSEVGGRGPCSECN